jgi:hypothetical protein
MLVEDRKRGGSRGLALQHLGQVSAGPRGSLVCRVRSNAYS